MKNDYNWSFFVCLFFFFVFFFFWGGGVGGQNFKIHDQILIASVNVERIEGVLTGKNTVLINPYSDVARFIYSFFENTVDLYQLASKKAI